MTEINLGKLTQVERVIWYMQTNGSITPLEAKDELGIMRLAATIHTVKKLGYSVHTEMVKVKDRFGSETHVASYSLLSA